MFNIATIHLCYSRFYCQEEYDTNETLTSDRDNPDSDMFLSVQTLQFQGNVELPKRSRNGFKYKSPSGRDTHRMFVKQAISDEDCSDDGRSSQLTSYYFDDYVKYLFNNDKSRPTSGKSSIFLQSLSNKKENKATQVDENQGDGSKQTCHGINGSISKSFQNKYSKKDIKSVCKSNEADTENTKIFFHNDGRRKSLTISRTESPETMQVIRVDVVRNNSHNSSVMSDFADKRSKCNATDSLESIDLNHIDMKKPHFTNKYLLTNAIKALDENCGGEKVTLLCKTFKLSERSQVPQLNKSKVNTEIIQNANTLKNNITKQFRK